MNGIIMNALSVKQYYRAQDQIDAMRKAGFEVDFHRFMASWEEDEKVVATCGECGEAYRDCACPDPCAVCEKAWDCCECDDGPSTIAQRIYRRMDADEAEYKMVDR
jgi:hypothetical protein